jgi:hypothetical protein
VAIAAEPATAWASVFVADWYGRGPRAVEIATATAVWYHSGLPPVPLRWVLIRDPVGAVAPQALLGTDLAATPAHILGWFVHRWQLEVTFEAARRHLGVETQRPWSDRAIRHATPALLGLFSLVTLTAHHHFAGRLGPVPGAAWSRMTVPTFAGALALIHRSWWAHPASWTSDAAPDMVKVPRAVIDRLTHLLCYAA